MNAVSARGTYHMTFGCGEVTVADVDVDAAAPMLILLLLLQRMRRAAPTAARRLQRLHRIEGQ